ncbi:hypothetical protein M9Y10_036458 [Tritrichomonas musculus]|uniref:DUF3447 domain-containing protein n=1 Tax=Tritrichomonas musculus TaxID=1915356 RepID=A0ABR2GUB3_9EUKA
MFCKKAKFAFSSWKSNNFETLPHTLFLLSGKCEFPIFEIMPKQFTISTKNSESHFNLEMLKETSSVISDLIRANPNEDHYFLNISDEENVLGKFEQLYQGKTVIFDEDEFPISHRITKILQIKNCPNYLKPESLRSNTEVDSNGFHSSQTDTRSGVEIYHKWFANYLRREELKTFTIVTNRKEYKCNMFGIYASNVISQILEKDPTTNKYLYDFDDEFDEFQLICDLFNFKKVDITNDNMDVLKEMAESLQITYIIKQIDSFINNYQNYTQKIDEQQTIIDSIDNLFDLLYNIRNYSIQKVKNSIVNSQWCQSEENVQELAAFILQVVKPNSFLHKEMVELLIQLNEEANDTNKLNILLPFIVNKLMTVYMRSAYQDKLTIDDFDGRQHDFSLINDTDYSNHKSVFFFIFLLYKRGIISKADILDKLKNYDCQNRYLNAFFIPEIIELNPKSINSIRMQNPNFERFDQNDDNFYLFVNKFLPDKIDLYKQMLDNLEPDDELTKSLRYDDVDRLQLLINQNGIDITTAVVPYNIFDDFDENINIINYAAFYGSLKCFKYLLLNDGLVDESTLYFAVYGGNVEIIKIVDQRIPEVDNQNNIDKINNNNKGFGFMNRGGNYVTKIVNGKAIYIANYSNVNLIIRSTIIMHRNDLFDWLFDKKFVSKGKLGNELNNIGFASVENGNAHSLIEVIDKGFDISSQNIVLTAAQNGFYKLTQLLLSMIDQDVKKSIINSFSTNSLLNEFYCSQSSVYFGNLSIFKLFYNDLDPRNRETAILYAISMDYEKIIDFFFDNFDKLNCKITNLFVNLALNISLTKKTEDYFSYLMEKLNEIKPSAFKLKLFINLLNNACASSNLSATKKITDLIMKENQDFNFSLAFIKASSVGSKDICQFFLEKKVYINYEQISLQVTRLGSIDVEIFKMIFKNVNSTTKLKFLKCIDQAILKKNKKLVEFLLTEKAPIKNALFEAVYAHDLEIVDLVLKYNSKPSFVNQNRHEGTALISAIRSDDLDIVKRLLSVPGIDPSLENMQGDNAFITAIMNYNLDIIDAIIDFYGDDIHNHAWIYKALQTLSRRMSNDNPRDIEWKVIQRLFKIKSIDLNFCDDYTFFYKACYCNQMEIVESFLSLDGIDVNKHEINSYQTPLMIAIDRKNKKIAELLIQYPKTDINVKNLYDESAFTIAVRNNLKEIVDLFMKNERFDPIESGFNFAFFNANTEMIEHLSSSEFLDVNYNYEIYIKNNINNNNNNNNFMNNDRILDKVVEKTALTHSVEINDIDKIDFIINHPTFDKDKSDIVTAIFVAAEKNNIDIFRKLIKLIDNDIDIENQQGESLLVVAAKNLSGAILDELFNDCHFDPAKCQIVNAFIKSYCGTFQLENQSKDQIIPPWRHQQEELLCVTSKIDVPPWQERLHNETIWLNQQQVQNQELIPDLSTRIEIMEKIYNFDLENSKLINFNKILANGKSFFTIICQDNEEIGDVSDFLLDHGVDPNLSDEDGIYPLLTAIGLNSFNFVSSLINSKKIVYSQLGNRTTYLHAAAAFADAKILKLLLDENVFDINATDINGETPLMLACRSKNIDKIVLLLEKDDIDYLHCNKAGSDALEIVRKLSPNELKNARKSKDDYKNKIVSIINDQPRFSFSARNNNNILMNNISFSFGDQD